MRIFLIIQTENDDFLIIQIDKLSFQLINSV